MRLKLGEIKEATDGFAYSLEAPGIVERVNLKTWEVERFIDEGMTGSGQWVNKRLLCWFKSEFDDVSIFNQPKIDA